MTGLSTASSTDLEALAEELYRRYAYPEWLRRHSLLVGRIGAVLATAHPGPLDRMTVILASYLHDVGRSPLLAGDPREHNEVSADVLVREGLAACAEPARRHAVYAVLEPSTMPTTLEEKIVYVADRRGGMSVETLEERAQRTARRHPRFAEDIARAVPIAEALEREVFAAVSFAPEDLAARVEVPR